MEVKTYEIKFFGKSIFKNFFEKSRANQNSTLLWTLIFEKKGKKDVDKKNKNIYNGCLRI